MSELPPGSATATIGDLIASDGIFRDGDWVETKDQDPEGDIRLTQLADIGDGFFRDRSSRFLASESAAHLGCTFLEPADVLIARMPDPLGRACLFPGDPRPCVTAVDVCIVRPGSSSVDPRWLMWWINTPRFRGDISVLQAGTTRKRISRKNLATIEFPVPPLNEQRRIVAAIEEHLSRLDAADTSLAAASARARSLRVAMLVQALDRDWPAAAVGDVAEVISGPAFKSSFFGGPGEGIRLLRGENIEPGALRWRETRTWPESMLDGYGHLLVEQSDLILAMDRPVISSGLKLAPVQKDDLPALLVQRVARIRPSERMLTGFLHAVLQLPRFIPHVIGDQTGTQLPHITLAGIRAFEVPLPPLEEQRRIVAEIEERLGAIAALRAAIERAQRRGAALRRLILERAFRGELVPQDPSDEPASVLLDRIRAERDKAGRANRRGGSRMRG